MNKEDIRQVMEWLGFFPKFHDGTKAQLGEYRRSGYYLGTFLGLVWQPTIFENPEDVWGWLPTDEMQLLDYALSQIPQSPRLDICPTHSISLCGVLLPICPTAQRSRINIWSMHWQKCCGW